jgi:glycerol kinase
MSDTETYVLALDQGTTSSRAIVFDRDGLIKGVQQREFKQHYPKPGWVEHDPLEIWESQLAVMHEAIENAGIESNQVVAIGITNQRETTVVWDRHTGEPVYPAIVWQDRRTANYCRTLIDEGQEPAASERTGLRFDPYFSGTKLKWILDNCDGARAKAESGDVIFGTIDTWLLWKLSGGKLHVTDASNASRTLLLNIHNGDWDADMLALLDIPRAMLPEVKSSSEVYGTVDESILPGGIPLSGVAGDQQAALFGQSCFHPGMVKNTYGTGCFLLMNIGSKAVPSKNNLLTTIAWKLGDEITYALEGSVFIGGAVIQWLRDELKLIATAPECDELASTVTDTNGVYLVPAFAGLGAPHWDPNARGTIVGLTRGANRAHFCRAALESIAYQSADVINCMEKDSGDKLLELRVDGGASRSEPLLQFQADLLQSSVVRPVCIETTALGAAYLAGLAVGYWESMETIEGSWQIDKRVDCLQEAEAMQPLTEGWTRAIERSRDWAVD